MDRFPKVRRPFHPKDPAYGTRNYDVGALNERRKRNLNARKIVGGEENLYYLRTHPEVEALISILFRRILCERPAVGVRETVGTFFNRPRRRILVDLLDYFLRVE